MKIRKVIGAVMVASPFAIIFAADVANNGLGKALIGLVSIGVLLALLFVGMKLLDW